MKTQNVRDFLSRFSVEELKDRGILRGISNQLKALSVEPLIELMRENGLERLDFPDRNWYLDDHANFSNPASSELKEGNVSALSNPGAVFNLTNSIINPYFQGYSVAADTEREVDEAEEVTFKLERDLQNALRKNIAQLESGLKIIDGGSEQTVEAGRIDITARDKNKAIVVVELKAGVAQPDSLTQILAYMSSLINKGQNPVRGILVAADFHPKVILAAKVISNIQLKQYTFKFTFKDR
ncbi:MAG: DUF91 domain-containing protein [Candidatus Lokiarchaeota archaeon]|nr:DUF91 domain-containing protein [Candidatus Lokiarchaeota archaeon]